MVAPRRAFSYVSRCAYQGGEFEFGRWTVGTAQLGTASGDKLADGLIGFELRGGDHGRTDKDERFRSG